VEVLSGSLPPSKVGEQLPSRFGPRLAKWTRRIHLYLGMFMMPWVLLFGITALSFNHPSIWRNLSGRLVPPPEFRKLSGFEPWNPNVIATELVTRLKEKGTALEVEPESATFRGWAFFARPGEAGTHVVIVGLDRGVGFLSTRPTLEESQKPSFFGESITLPRYNTAELAQELEPLHQKLGIVEKAALRPHPEVHPELRFVARDDKGRRWNVVYDLSSGTLDGRPSEEGRHAPTIELLESLHTQHHFPPTFGPTTLWAIFSDLTALTIVLWAATGLAMALQLRKLRRIIIATLVVGLIAAGSIMKWTASDLSFGPERAGAKK